MSRSDGESKIIQTVSELASLCSFPGGLMRVLGVIADERSTRFTLARAIETDPALSERVVRAANSPLYLTYYDRVDASSPPVGNLPVAILKIGFQGVRNIAFTQGVCDLSRTAGDVGVGLLSHLLVVAEIARALGTRKGRTVGEEAYFAGLMHDLGKLVLLRTLPQAYGEVVERCQSEMRPALAVEEEVLTPIQPLLQNHVRAGAALLRAHRIPQSIIECIERHHGEPRSQDDLTAIVIAADDLAYGMGCGDTLYEPSPSDVRAPDLGPMLGNAASTVGNLTREALVRVGEFLESAGLPPGNEAQGRLRRLRERGPELPDGWNRQVHSTSDLYAAAMVVLEQVRDRKAVTREELDVRVSLSPPALDRLLDRLIVTNYLHAATSPRGAPEYRLTQKLRDSEILDVLNTLAIYDWDDGIWRSA